METKRIKNMTGVEFYNVLKHDFTKSGQVINKYFFFEKWIKKDESDKSFQFRNRTHRKKAIPKKWLVEAKNAKNNNEEITRRWFDRYFNKINSSDCRVSVALHLLNTYE